MSRVDAVSVLNTLPVSHLRRYQSLWILSADFPGSLVLSESEMDPWNVLISHNGELIVMFVSSGIHL